MDILMSYLKTGKTISNKKILMVLCVFSLCFGLLFYGLSYAMTRQGEVATFLNNLPTIEIDKGKVIKPADTLQEFNISTHPIRFIINTKISDLSNPQNNTIVLTQNALYATVNNQTQKSDLPTETVTINKDFIMNGIIKIAGFMFALSLIILIVGFYGTYLISLLLLKVLNKSIGKEIVKKTSFIGWISIIILNTILMLMGYGFSALNSVFLASFISVFCLFQIKD